MAKARPTTSEIDRFLEEVNRRKQQQQAKQGSTAPPPVQQAPAKPRPVAPPVPQVSSTRVQQKQVIVADNLVRTSPEVISDSVRDYFNRQTEPTTHAQIIPPTLSRNLETPAVQQAKSLLKSQGGLRAVFILNEILSPPLSQRRRQK
jgi:hypothetical protein